MAVTLFKMPLQRVLFFFFLKDRAPPEISPLPPPAALPIGPPARGAPSRLAGPPGAVPWPGEGGPAPPARADPRCRRAPARSRTPETDRTTDRGGPEIGRAHV